MHTFIKNLLNGQSVEWKALGEVAEIYGGLTGKSKNDFENGNAKYISYKNIFDNIEVNLSTLDKVNVYENEKQHLVKYGDVLFTGSSETANEAGMSSAVTTKFDENIYLNSFSFGIRFNEGVCIIPEFSKHLFRSHFMRLEIAKTASGVTRFNISKARFKKIKIPIPPLEIQEKIVKILDKLTKLTAELTAEHALRQKQYQYYRDKLLNFSDNVEWKSLGEVAKKIYSGKNKEKNANGIYSIYGSTGIIGKTNIKAHEGEKILVARVGANAGFVHIAQGEYDVSDNTLVIEEDRSQLILKYLYYVLESMNLNQFAKGAGQPLITGGYLKSITIPIPPLEIQAQIVAILDKFDTLIHSISEGLPREIELRQKQYEYYRELLLDFNMES